MKMFKTTREDWYFIVPSSLIFFFALIISVWDFIIIQKANYGIINIIGVILFLTGLIIRLIGKRTLGRYYSYGLKTLPDHKLIKHGIYKHIRHPIYLAIILYGMGIPMFFSSLYGFLIMLCLIPLIFYRIKIEEKMLLNKFGEEYRDYMEKSKKLIPFVF
jgi:protein-S-isoprenylcysteine O-methyltransferase Ste14